MKEKRLFLQWAVVACLIAVGAVFAERLGWYDIVYEGDATRLSFLIMAIFAACTALSGLLAWKIGGLKASGLIEQGQPAAEALKRLRIRLGRVHFGATVSVSLGLLGTVFGLTMMIATGDAPAGDQTEIAEAFVVQIKSGMATAFLTTIVGGICGILLELQAHLLSEAIDEASP